MITTATRRAALLILLALSFAPTACADDSLVGPVHPTGPGPVPPPAEPEPIEMVLQNGTSSVMDVCPNLQVPAGQTLAIRVYASGDQIYRWNGNAWSFVAPSALLYSAPDERAYFGSHYGGPTWESRSGSRVVGAVTERCTPDAAAIPWLLLKVVDAQGSGALRDVEYIQRLHTVGGLAPATSGTFVGEEARVPYTTIYTFFKAE